jgi:hypothetical protein
VADTTATLVLNLEAHIVEAVARALAARAPGSADPAMELRARFYGGPPAMRFSLRETALALGVSRQTVKRLLDRGMPHRKSALGDYVVVVGDARAWLERQERMPDVVPIRRRA